ncbi:multidrug effflux MFS transporter (plasmid) [Roseomonas marmotae]|uniref:Bcr/CflA family efflux transporter n=1 Tax=Roseomonas marmotae TaxID=2768161 RepID=A0ABS3KEK2_9PROT|nr:multidrug effflux MFS transporter [Roseomonas marmotae]MBO1075896.1 multidrug effflux MFS transporter [Roseomonas marmotae]QTI82023.1 multidrug effflux MFS transporter [Roseomonas marmotae]
MGFKQFVAIIAAMMMTNALAIDSMLPALPEIGHALGVTSDNQRQWIITAYLLGFGAPQIIYGPLADRFGRKPVLLTGFVIYTLASILAMFSGSFATMLLARVLQGTGAAATRVLAVSIVRDCYSGRKMAQVMSLAFIVFLAVPVVAPSLGQLIVLVAPWPFIFLALAVFGGAVGIWITLRLPETLHPEDRMPIAAGRIMAAFRLALTNRQAVGYMLAMALMLGGLFGFINSAQQVFADTFRAPELFTTIFAAVAMAMAIASLLNARLVGRFGTRRISHTMLLGYIGFAVVHAAVALSGHESLLTFSLLQAGMMFCFGLTGPNFGSMAMEPLGHIAGTASSVQGFVTTVVGALIGFFVGQQFDGTTAPLMLGFAGCGIMALVLVLFAERGQLFRSRQGA